MKLRTDAAEEWLYFDERLRKFSLTGEIDGSFQDEWELYDAVISHLGAVPASISDTAIVSPTAEIYGNVLIDYGAEILPFTIIKGPAYIGRNVVVGNFSFVRPFTFLSQETLLGNHSYCNEVVSAPKCRASHYVGCSRSILMRNSTLSSFVLTATLRADYKPVLKTDEKIIKKRGCVVGQNSYLAPHVTVLPGVRIGKNCFIGSHVTVARDVADNKSLKASVSLIEKENVMEIPEREYGPVL
jgi:acetyltransferase-like isoleucine patch superfamily enzyme